MSDKFMTSVLSQITLCGVISCQEKLQSISVSSLKQITENNKSHYSSYALFSSLPILNYFLIKYQYPPGEVNKMIIYGGLFEA